MPSNETFNTKYAVIIEDVILEADKIHDDCRNLNPDLNAELITGLIAPCNPGVDPTTLGSSSTSDSKEGPLSSSQASIMDWPSLQKIKKFARLGGKMMTGSMKPFVGKRTAETELYALEVAEKKHKVVMQEMEPSFNDLLSAKAAQQPCREP